MLLDEPTNHRDPHAQLDVLALVDSLETTRIIGVHNLDYALAHADLTAVLNGGRLVGFGPPADVLTDHLTTAVFVVRTIVGVHPLTGRPHFLTAPVTTGH